VFNYIISNFGHQLISTSDVIWRPFDIGT